MIGVAPVTGETGGFDAEVTRTADSFEGPVSIVAARGAHLDHPETAPLEILVPVNGTDVSRRGMEVALALARASGTSVTALYVPGDEPARTPLSSPAEAPSTGVTRF